MSSPVAPDAPLCATSTYKLNVVNGVPFPPIIRQEQMDALRDFPLRADDLFVVTYPKSGTTWMQQIVKLIRTNGVDTGQLVSQAVPWLEKLYSSSITSEASKVGQY